MNFFRIMYLDDNKKRRRLIIESERLSSAILTALLELSDKCDIVSYSELKPYEIKRLKVLEEKDLFFSKTIKVIPPKSQIYPKFIFAKEKCSKTLQISKT